MIHTTLNPKKVSTEESFSGSRSIYFLLLVAAALLFFGLSFWGVTESSEARYAEISWEMLKSGDYLHPRLLSIGHYHKPPFTYWITAFAYSLFGPSVFAARFFLQIALLCQIWLVFRIGRILFPASATAFLAAVIYLSFPAVIIAGRALTTDAYLTTFILAAVYAWMRYRQAGKTAGLYFFYIFLGLGFLTKGPVVFLVPLVVAPAFNRFYPGQPAKAWKLQHAFGLLLFLFIGFGWFLMLYRENPDFLSYFLYDHTVERIATNSFGRSQPFWFYLMTVSLTAFPWFLMLFKPLLKLGRTYSSALKLILLWVFIPFLFFSLTTSKLILYVLPLYAGIALGAAHIWTSQLQHRKRWNIAFMLFSALALAGLPLVPFIDPRIQLSLPVYLLVGFTLAGMLMLSKLYFKARPYVLLPALSVSLTACLSLCSPFIFRDNPAVVHDQRRVADFIRQLPKHEQVYVYDERLPSLAFHLQQPIISVNAGDSDLARETQFETDERWKSTLIRAEAFPQQAAAQGAVLVVKKKDKIPDDLQYIFTQFPLRQEIDGWFVYFTEN